MMNYILVDRSPRCETVFFRRKGNPFKCSVKARFNQNSHSTHWGPFELRPVIFNHRGRHPCSIETILGWRIPKRRPPATATLLWQIYNSCPDNFSLSFYQWIVLTNHFVVNLSVNRKWCENGKRNLKFGLWVAPQTITAASIWLDLRFMRTH